MSIPVCEGMLSMLVCLIILCGSKTVSMCVYPCKLSGNDSMSVFMCKRMYFHV